MRRLLALALIGFAAQLVDGALGMGHGVTSTTLLLAVGTAPAAASASVHLAEVGTSLSAGVAHWHFGNVDRRVLVRIAGPGALGAFLGALLLSRLSTEAAAPWMSGILTALGLCLLLRFTRRLPPRRPRPLGSRHLAPLGLVAGFVDATGGGWGPVATPALLVGGRLEPRKAVGTVDTAECLVAVSAAVGFLVGLGRSGFATTTVIAMMAGGVMAAPIAAWLVRRLPAQILGSALRGLIVLTNVHGLLDVVHAGPGSRWALHGAVLVLWGWALGIALRVHRNSRPPLPGVPVPA
ncbi:MAG: uncharacterized protein QG608_2768 [Actinomycetota bacterium]|nr:uncharacterized protein [Actinomycetota bacterium]